MKNLLRAELVRLRRSPGLWAAAVLALAFSVSMLFSWLRSNQMFLAMGDEGRILHTEDFLFCHARYLSYLIAGFAALYLGAEFSSGGVRNKIARGVSRTRVYLSHLIAVALGGSVVCAVPPAVSLMVGLPLYGPPTVGAGAILTALAGTLGTALALSALFTAIVTALGGRAAAVVPCAALALAGYVAASHIKIYLLQCEQLPGADARWYGLCRLLYDFLPAGQLAQYAALETGDLPAMAGYALALAALSAAVGPALFRRQELR